jgi:chromosome segregation ATPase
MGDIGGSKNKFSIDNDSDNKNKSNKGSSFATDMATELLGANVAANRISDSIEDLSGHLNNVVDSMKEMNNLTPQEQAKAYDDLVNSMIKVQDEMDKYGEQISFIEGKQESLTRQQKEFTDALDAAVKMEDEGTNRLKELANVIDAQEKALEDYESALSDTKKEVEAYTNALKELEDEAKKLNLKLFDEETGEQVKDIEKIMDAYDSLTDSLGKRMSDIAHNNLGEILESFVDLKDEARKAAESLDLLFAGEGNFYGNDEWIQEVIKQMKEFAQLCRDGVPTDGLERVRDLYREIKDALSNYNKAFEEQSHVEGMIFDQEKALERLADAQERLNA